MTLYSITTSLITFLFQIPAGYVVMNSPINLSDYLPIKIVCQIGSPIKATVNESTTQNPRSLLYQPKNNVTALEWNHVASMHYYDLTRIKMQPIFERLDIFSKYISQAAKPADSLLDPISSPNASFLNTIKQSIEKFYL